MAFISYGKGTPVVKMRKSLSSSPSRPRKRAGRSIRFETDVVERAYKQWARDQQIFQRATCRVLGNWHRQQRLQEEAITRVCNRVAHNQRAFEKSLANSILMQTRTLNLDRALALFR